MVFFVCRLRPDVAGSKNWRFCMAVAPLPWSVRSTSELNSESKLMGPFLLGYAL